MGRPPPTPNRKNEPNIDYPNETASMLKARSPVSKESRVGDQRDVSLVPNYRILAQGLGDTERTSLKRNKVILKTKRRVLLRPAEEDSLYSLTRKRPRNGTSNRSSHSLSQPDHSFRYWYQYGRSSYWVPLGSQSSYTATPPSFLQS